MSEIPMDENREQQLDLLRAIGRNLSNSFMKTGANIPEIGDKICCACNSTSNYYEL